MAPPALERKVGLLSAVSLNMMNMIGVGPFITLPLVVAAMAGPQAMFGWLLGAAIALCDGLVWAELGAMMPRAGGSYAFLREIYGGRDGTHPAGRFVSFLYIWQLSFTAPLSIASGCIGLAQYAAYLWPSLARPVFAGSPIKETSLVAAGTCLLVMALLYRNVAAVARVAWVLTGGVVATMIAVIVAGWTHMQPQLLHMPPVHLGSGFFEGLALATLITTYDYWGYYNVCFLGAEVLEPAKTIPRAILLSIAIVALLYLAMNVAVLGVIPWRELAAHPGQAAMAVLMRRTEGPLAATMISLLIMWTAFASVVALLLGYSRAPYAAAVDGNYFRVFARLHPKHGFPHIALLALGATATVFCFFNLSQVIAALVAVRIVLQYVLQQVGVIVLRIERPAMPRPFRMWLYPLPPIIALSGFLFLLVSRKGAGRELGYAAAVAVSGTLVYAIRARRARA
jgi:APA family basic amino acid/polyamine antiporter